MSTIEQSSYSFKFASWSLAGLALSLGVSKAGVNLFSALLLLAFISVWICNRDKFRFAQMSSVSRSLLALFGLGLVCSLLSHGGSESTKDFANKGSLLLVLPISLFFLRNKVAREHSLYALLFGGLVAFGYSFYLWIQMTSAGVLGRVASFWDLGRWGEYLCYFLMLLTPLLFSGVESRQRKALFIVCYVVAFLALLTSGMRGPFLAIAIATGAYFILFNRRLLLPFSLLFIGLLGLIYITAPTVIEYAAARFASIFDFTNLSNLARLHMWAHALDFFHYNLSQDVRSIIFGSGFENLASTFEPFLDATNQRTTLMTASGGEASYNDHHNAFLNSLNKMGVVYLIGMAVAGYHIVKALLSRLQQAPNNPWYQSAFIVLISYMIIGVFYSNELNFQTLMAGFMCVLAVRFGDSHLKESQSHV